MFIEKHVCFFLFFVISICVNAQIDTTFIQPDTLSPTISTESKVEKPKKKFTLRGDRKKPETPLFQRIMKPEKHSPLSATVYSLALPGAGQVYNKKYWKLPIVYGGLGWMGYRIHQTTKIHRIYRDAYLDRLDDDFTNDTMFVSYTDSNLDTRRLSSKKQQELAIIGFGVVYILVAVDAFVDAHLWSFDVNDDLSMKIGPTLLPPTPQHTANIGISLQLRAKAPPDVVPLSILTE